VSNGSSASSLNFDRGETGVNVSAWKKQVGVPVAPSKGWIGGVSAKAH
jgi:hypothetical protein